jgi:hypothetical protein
MIEPHIGWPEQLAQLRRRVEELRARGRPPPLRGDAGWVALARVREGARPLLESIVTAYAGLCPSGFPVVEDNRIEGPGGSIGVRFGPRHALFIALEHEARRKPVEAKPAGLAGALGVRMKRMPGDPLPPRDPHQPLELVVLGLRWDDDRGWVEVRRRLDPRWDPRVLREHFAAYLSGLNYDIAAGLLAGDDGDQGDGG